MESSLKNSRHPVNCPWHYDWHRCNCGLFEILVYNEPGKDNDRITRRITVEDAIDKQILYAKSKNCSYDSQEDALEDFIALHWAIYEEL